MHISSLHMGGWPSAAPAKGGRRPSAVRPPLWDPILVDFSPTDALFWWISLRQMLKPLIFSFKSFKSF